MKLRDLNLAEFMPMHFREDTTAMGLIYAVEKQMKKIVDEIGKIQIYASIDKLPEKILDELAWQFNCFEYNGTYSIDIKRELIKKCILTHRKRGTVEAVENVITDIFGIGWVEEWFDYPEEGEPFHFKVHTTNPDVGTTEIAEFNRVLKTVKNARSILDEIIVELNIKGNIGTAGVMSVAEYINV